MNELMWAFLFTLEDWPALFQLYLSPGWKTTPLPTDRVYKKVVAVAAVGSGCCGLFRGATSRLSLEV